MPASPGRAASVQDRHRAQGGHLLENAKKISKLIRDEGPKGVKAQIRATAPGSSKSRDDLQTVSPW